MATLQTLVSFLDALLAPEKFKDSALNGLQVQGPDQEVTRIALAVDAGLSVVEQAVANKAQLLIVHHGIFWGREQAIVGAHAQKLRLLLTGGCSLYAAHLPLDAHAVVGNNAELGRILQLRDLQPFAAHHGQEIGVRGVCDPRSIGDFSKTLATLEGATTPLELPFGMAQIRSVGIVSGGAAADITQAASAKLDLFISGEPTHWVYHLCKELRINAIFAGHYATETVGVKALGKLLEKEFHVQSFFIHEPSGI